MKEVEEAVSSYQSKIKAITCKNKFAKAAQAIANDKIVGWFQGGSECGPRALGNRSILANPRNPDMKDILNSRVKFRESFRPFAPSVLYEYQQEYFDLDVPSPYMLIIADVIEEKKADIPSVVHVDGTARLQTVLEELNPTFYQLIKAFYQKTGVPVLLNTSFNINKEPIVETPQDAIRCFLNSDFDELYIEDMCIEKK
jgi:Predicted carbamoyl transferase, NodU family